MRACCLRWPAEQMQMRCGLLKNLSAPAWHALLTYTDAFAAQDDDELRELGRRWRAAQATAPLEPASQAAAEAEAAAMRAGFATRGE